MGSVDWTDMTQVADFCEHDHEHSNLEYGATWLLRGVKWLKFTDVSGRLVGPITWVSEELPVRVV
jgi:hypothetical protein